MNALDVLGALLACAENPALPEWRGFDHPRRGQRRCRCGLGLDVHTVRKGARTFLLATCQACGACTADQTTNLP